MSKWHRYAPLWRLIASKTIRQTITLVVVSWIAASVLPTSVRASPAPVIYQLSAYGLTLVPIVESVRRWGEEHLLRARAEATKGNLTCGSAVRLSA